MQPRSGINENVVRPLRGRSFFRVLFRGFHPRLFTFCPFGAKGASPRGRFFEMLHFENLDTAVE
jgi:hypothetical protein